MRARGHLVGGLVTGSGVAGIGILAGQVPGLLHPHWWGVAATGLFFSLFPDVDTDSLPARWFYRFVVVGLIALALTGQERLGLWLAILSMLPLLDHHRGWTHGRWMPLIAPAILGVGAALEWREKASPEMFAPLDILYYSAAVVGWYTHLLLDGLFRLFPQDLD